MRTDKSGEKGQAVIVVALTITLLLMFVGIAIDSGIGYGVKAKLSSAVDAAALAAGKALGQAGTDAGRIANAELAARTFFAANFPDGYLRAHPTMQDPVIVHDQALGQWNISVTASATVPTFFLRLAGNNTTVTAQSAASAVRRDLDMAFIIDNTGSITENPADPQRVRDGARYFVNLFIPSSDRIALVLFAFGADVIDRIRTPGRGFDNTSVVNHINSMDFKGNTNFSEAFWRGWDQLDSIPPTSRSSLRAIVFFSDGAPNSFSSTFDAPSCTPPTNTGVIVTGDNGGSTSGLTRIGSVGGTSSGCPASSVDSMPAFFNLGPGVGDNTFHVTSPPSGPGLNPRPVTSTVDYTNVNNAARNLPEYMANAARKTGIYVFTLGLGHRLTVSSGANNERGDTVLKRMANDPTADTYDPSQPVGLYCFAADAGGSLTECYNRIASRILRLTR